jgi:hypothetical protein
MNTKTEQAAIDHANKCVKEDSRLLLLLAVITAILLLLASGCTGSVNVPKTHLAIKAPKWQMDLKSEKDTRLDSVKVDILTNGTVNVSIANFTATNSPVVIRETGKAQALTIDAQGRLVDAAGNVVGKIVEGVAVLYGP